MAKHTHEKCAYTRQAREYGTMLKGFNVPVGAIYGRENDTFYVSLYRNVRAGQMAVYVKPSGEDWARKMLPVGGNICQAIFAYCDAHGADLLPVGSWRNPDAKRRTKRKKSDQAKRATTLPVVEANGKRYRAIPYEMTLPDRVASKELRSITPNMRGANYEFNARMKPDRATYAVDFQGVTYIFRGTEDAEAFCHQFKIPVKAIKQEFLYNEANELAYNQVTMPAYWANMDSATSGKASVVAAHYTGWEGRVEE